ncbi:hypothetical protein Lepto7375DRAFT_5056 [Leptolyngbya sp. PCC 7375]|nr:hypothetical protein Lepto7375DRAFT_5056 [Leptolyngbya sp. PCC 7375]
MKHVQHDALEQAIDIRAARTLCRDGWSCEQINAVLKNVDISHQQFETIQAQSRELDELQQVFGPPINSLRSEHAEPSQSDLDFLNRGPDAAASVLREKGWNSYEIELVIRESMFVPLEEPKLTPQQPAYAGYPTTIPVFPTQSQNGYALGYPDGGVAAAATLSDRSHFHRTSIGTLKRDIFILTFMATIGLVMVFTLL